MRFQSYVRYGNEERDTDDGVQAVVTRQILGEDLQVCEHQIRHHQARTEVHRIHNQTDGVRL